MAILWFLVSFQMNRFDFLYLPRPALRARREAVQKVVTQGRHEPPPARCESKNGRAGFRDAKMPKSNRFECHGVDRDTPSVLGGEK